MKLRIFFSLFIISVSLFIFFYLQQLKKEDIDNLGSSITDSIERIYNTSFEIYKLSAQKEYHNLLQNKQAIAILKKFKYASFEEKKLLRGELYRLYAKHYKYLKTIGVRQFHFHTYDGKSLLRFHKPYENGDSLMDIRNSIKIVNKEFKNFYGFEGGKIYPGFRYMFPIIVDGDHLGSVEYSVSFEAIEKIMKKTFPHKTFILHLDRSISHDKVFEWYRKYFSPSGFSKDHFIENQELSVITNKVSHNKTIQQLNTMLQKDNSFQKKFNQKKNFSIPLLIESQGYMVSFLSIQDSTDKHAAYLVTYFKNDDINLIENKYLIFNLILLAATLFILVLVDIIRQQIEKIIEQKEQLEQINTQQFNQLSEYVTIIDKNVLVSSTDLKGNIIYVSEALCEMSGYTKEELLGKNHNIFRNPNMSKVFFENMWKRLEKNKVFKGELSNLRKDGTTYWVKVTVTPMYNEKNKKIGYTAIRQDITDKKIIEEISITDGLTNIFNRRHFDKIFPKILNSAKRHNSLVSFLLIDIDHFKQYNDTYGHKMGDDVLIEVAAAIQNTLKRADDYCFRLGGEEFGVIFGIEDEKHAVSFSNTIRRSIQSLRIEHKANSAGSYVTASVGLVCKRANQIKNEEDLYHEADTYLYKAKKAGRNRVMSNLD